MGQTKLAGAAYVMVILASAVYMGDTACEFLAGLKAGVTVQSLDLNVMSSTNVDHASVTLTNPHGVTAESRCFVPVVIAKTGSKKVTGAVVCTGELKPKTTVNLSAPYEPGAVLEICGRDQQFGRVPDWSLCDFTLERK